MSTDSLTNKASLGLSGTASQTSRQKRAFRVDSLAIGMVIMLLMTVIGRGIGFIRGLTFCRLMDDADVGRWAMAFGFLTLITPVMLLGIPGVLPRFTEHFRLKGQLTLFVRRVGMGTIACTGLFVVVMLSFPEWFGWIVFMQPDNARLIYSIAVAVVGMVAYNFVSDLAGSLRQIRLVSTMQFTQGVGFTLLSIAWLLMGGWFEGVVWMYAASCFIATVPGLVSFIRNWASASQPDLTGEDECEIELDSVCDQWMPMVRRLAPYAVALWMTNLVGNLFALSDRYMILHYMPGGDDGLTSELAGQAAVGQYHSACIIPVLLISVGMMISGVLLPYLSADWEKGKVAAVKLRLVDALCAVALVFTCIAAIATVFAPWLFEILLQGRYADGLRLLPMTLCFGTWVALTLIGETYLLAAEKGKWISLAMGAGLVSNLLLNAWLLPRMGIDGAVVATLISNGLVMSCIWLTMIRCGFPVSGHFIWISVLPLTLIAHPLISMAVAIGVAVILGCDKPRRDRCLESIPDSVRSRLFSH